MLLFSFSFLLGTLARLHDDSYTHKLHTVVKGSKTWGYCETGHQRFTRFQGGWGCYFKKYLDSMCWRCSQFSAFLQFSCYNCQLRRSSMHRCWGLYPPEFSLPVFCLPSTQCIACTCLPFQSLKGTSQKSKNSLTSDTLSGSCITLLLLLLALPLLMISLFSFLQNKPTAISPPQWLISSTDWQRLSPSSKKNLFYSFCFPLLPSLFSIFQKTLLQTSPILGEW